MEEKLKEILKKYAKEVQRYTEKKTELLNKINFCTQHKFNEEVRIARVEYEAMDMLLYEFKCMHEETTELLNNWLS